MVELYEGLMTTRAVRRYTPEPVTTEEIEACIRAACQAPSGGNIQPYQFVVVTDPAVKKSLRDLYLKAYERYERFLMKTRPPQRTPEEEAAFQRGKAASDHLAENLHNAPALVLFLMPIIPWTWEDEEGPMDQGPLYASVYPAVQNFILAARSMGIGTVLTTVFRIYQDEVRSVLGIPDRYEICALIPMGRPVGKFGAGPRKPADKITHWDRFGNKRAFTGVAPLPETAETR